jgi:hypothetical protein
MSSLIQPHSGGISVATGFNRWSNYARANVSAVGTTDVCRAYGTLFRYECFHRLKPVARGMSPLSRLYNTYGRSDSRY